jgi:hypothetical protein
MIYGRDEPRGGSRQRVVELAWRLDCARISARVDALIMRSST